MATFSYEPTYIFNKTVTPRVRRTQFGDGYTQRSGDGLNTQRQLWSLEFVGTVAEIDTIESFLEATGGVDNFTWTPPRQTNPLKFIYISYDRDSAGPTTDRLTTSFRQEFDL
jgi:phage-related protein